MEVNAAVSLYWLNTGQSTYDELCEIDELVFEADVFIKKWVYLSLEKVDFVL